MFQKLFSLFTFTKKRRGRKHRTLRRSRNSRKLKQSGGWGGAILPEVKKSGLMKGGWGEPVTV